MAKRKRRRKTRKYSSRKKLIREGNAIIKDTPDDQSAAKLLGQVFSEKDDVLDATDLNSSFEYFQSKKKRK